MQNNFDLKKFLIENKLTPSAQNKDINEGYDEDKIAKYKEYTYTLGGKKVIPNDIDFYGNVLGIEIDGEVYRPGMPDEKGNIELKPRKGKTGMYTESKHSDEADLKKFLIENKLTPSAQNEGMEPVMLGVGDEITPDMLKNPSDFDFPMIITRFSSTGDEVTVKRVLKKKGMFGGEKEMEDEFIDLISNWEKYALKPTVKMTPQTEMDF